MAARLPEIVGVVGVGTIGSALVRGLCASGKAAKTKFVLSPRNAEKVASLAAEFPHQVSIAKCNQDVVDRVDCVVFGLLPKNATEIIGDLTFRKEHKVVSLVASLDPEQLQSICAPASKCWKAIPLPGMARGKGATVVMPPSPFVDALFSPISACAMVEDNEKFRRMFAIACIMGDFYKRKLTVQKWLVDGGIPEEEAARWTGSCFSAFMGDSEKLEKHSLQHLVEEQTPGGLNEMVWKYQQADGSYASLADSLDAVVHRLRTGTTDLNQSPAVRRASRSTAERIGYPIIWSALGAVAAVTMLRVWPSR